MQGWVIGQGWDANGWARAPDRAALDAVQPGPVYLDSLDVHAAWVNSAALAGRGNHARDTRSVRRTHRARRRGRAHRPPARARGRADDCRICPSRRPTLLDEALREAQAEAHRLGVTGIHDVEGDAALAAFERLEAAGRAPAPGAVPSAGRLAPRAGAARASGAATGSEWLRIGGVKMFLDGSLGSRTAWMLEPYEGTRDRGMPITTEDEAARAMRTAAAAGIASTVHAIGDAAVRRALDLMAPLPPGGDSPPHRALPVRRIRPISTGRPRPGLVVSMQPAHLLTDIPLVERHWGARGRGRLRVRDAAPAGHRRWSSAATCRSPRSIRARGSSPRSSAGTTTARPPGGWRPEEKLGFEDAVRAYTVGAAHAGRLAAARRARWRPGCDADLVAWAFDPAVERGAGDAVRAGRARLTVVGGEVVMQR